MRPKTWLSSDASFDITSTGFIPARFCYAVQPGVVDFPGRCVAPPGHKGTPHRSTPARLGTGTSTTYWDNEDE